MKAAVLLVLVIVAVAGCVGQEAAPVTPPAAPPAPPGAPPAAPPAAVADFREIQLRDVGTGAAFRLADFSGKVVVVETFAVWCPLCLDQQREIRSAEQSLGSADVVSISLDIDPNEDEARVLGHIQRNGFTWRFAVAPTELSRQLRDMFGLNVLNPPSTPIVILDREQQPHLLRYGIKRADEIQAEVLKYL